MNSRLLGGIFLIVGTCIGGGMIALPIVTATGGFINSVLFLFFCWLVMTIGAFLIMEVNMWLPPGCHLISMAKATLGHWGQALAWFSYLLLLYAVISAYIAGGGDMVHDALSNFHWDLPHWQSQCLFLLVFGAVVYAGIQAIDYVNRGLMSLKLVSFCAMLALIVPHANPAPLFKFGEILPLAATVTVMITSFGYATVVPSLRGYFHSDVNQLRKAVLVGSLIPLFIYIIWVGVIFAVIPQDGEFGLRAIRASEHSTADLLVALDHYLSNSWIKDIVHVFMSVCIATSFLGASLSLSDFLADGLNVKKSGKGAVVVYGATFIPPLVVVLFYQSAFIKALSVAGIFCAILLMLLPALMAWQGRYRLNLAKGYQLTGGALPLIVTIALSFVIIGLALHYDLHLFAS